MKYTLRIALISLTALLPLAVGSCQLINQAATDKDTLAASYEKVKPFIELGIDFLILDGKLDALQGAELRAKAVEMATALAVGDLDRAKAIGYPFIQRLARAGIESQVSSGKMSSIEAALILSALSQVGGAL